MNLSTIQKEMIKRNGGIGNLLIINDNIYMIMPNHRLKSLLSLILFRESSGESASAGGGGMMTLKKKSASASGSERTLDCTPRYSMRESPSTGEPQLNVIIEGEIIHIGN